MIVGVQGHDKVNIGMAQDAGFDCVEHLGQIVPLNMMRRGDSVKVGDFLQYLNRARDEDYPYLVISTAGDASAEDLRKIIRENADEIVKAGIPIYIENGMSGDDVRGYISNEFSDTRVLKEIVQWADKVCRKPLFGICVNTGYANLTAKNPRLLLEGAGNYLKLVHVNDNDGFINSMQMPYTFTKGRGDVTTDYYRLVGALAGMHYDERMIFDAVGLFNRTPASLMPAMLDMLANIAMYWLHIINYEGMLDGGRKIILFGAGRMAGNYMHIWGDRFKPAFLVDNDKDKWGTYHRGIEIKPPEAILEIPADERLVLLCNMRYEEIGMQLAMMGVEYAEYDDNYYDFIVQ